MKRFTDKITCGDPLPALIEKNALILRVGFFPRWVRLLQLIQVRRIFSALGPSTSVDPTCPYVGSLLLNPELHLLGRRPDRESGEASHKAGMC